MFYECNSLASFPDISKWNTSKVINIDNIFHSCFNSLYIIDNSKRNYNLIEDENAILKKDFLKGQKILIVMLWSNKLYGFENESIQKEYISKVSSESEFCLKDALDYLGITIDIVENYRSAIERITNTDENGKCPYYAIWIINGPPYDILPDGTKEGYLLGQFLEVLKFFWEKGGALIFLAGGGKLQYQTNEFLKILDFDGKKIDFYLVSEDEKKGIISHKGGKYLTGDETGLLKNKLQFSKKKEKSLGIERLSIGNNLFNLFEGNNLCYTNIDDYDKLLPFHPFSRDSENGITSLYYLSDEKQRGDIFIDCGFTKLFLNMKKDNGVFKYFQNIASWSARPELHLIYDGIDAKDWRPEGINYKIDINKKWTNFLPKPIELDLPKFKTLFAFDDSGSISGNSLYFNEIERLIKKYYKNGDRFFLWGSNYKELSKSQIDDWINKKEGKEGTESSNIAKIAKECPNYREHLLIVTDGSVGEDEIEKTDEFLVKNNIKFKYVTVCIICKNGNLSVGAPFCRECPFKIIQVTDNNTRIELSL